MPLENGSQNRNPDQISQILFDGSCGARDQFYREATASEPPERGSGHFFENDAKLRREMIRTRVAFRDSWNVRVIDSSDRVAFIVGVLGRKGTLASEQIEKWSDIVTDSVLRGELILVHQEADKLIVVANPKKRPISLISSTTLTIVILFAFLKWFSTIHLTPEQISVFREFLALLR